VDIDDSISCTWHGCYFAVAFFVLSAQFIFKLGILWPGRWQSDSGRQPIIPELAENVILRNLLQARPDALSSEWNRINLASNSPTDERSTGTSKLRRNTDVDTNEFCGGSGFGSRFRAGNYVCIRVEVGS
jgi:hypothetical protein